MSPADSRRLPQDQVELVVKALYVAAERLDWEHLPANRRTSQYDDWVTDPEIGEVLTKYMSAENARSWIKDGPMKEYSRARLGTGRYAKYGSFNGPQAAQLVRHALGADVDMSPGTLGIKPDHCLADTTTGTAYVAWGPNQNLRYLVWACIRYASDHPTHRTVVVITETMEHPTTAAEKTQHANIGKRCSIEFKYFRFAISRPADGDGG